jgi:AcrR family transcriptional regulator
MDGVTPPLDARTRILDATEVIVRDRGVAALTLESAAREAGVSKGGLLYHFAGKEALLTAALKRLADFVAADIAACVDAQAPGPGRVARATLAWLMGEVEQDRSERAAAVFLAAFHYDSALLDPIRAVVGRQREMIENDGLPPGHGAAIMAMGDGLFMARIFRLYTPTRAELEAMRAAAMRLLEPLS